MTTKEITTTITKEQFLSIIDNIIYEHTYFIHSEEAEDNLHYFDFEIYVDYREPAGFIESSSFKKILENDYVTESFEEYFCDTAFNVSIDYYYDDLESKIKEYLNDEQLLLFDEVYYDDVDEYIREHCSWYYAQKEFLQQEVAVSILVDSGNKNYDYGLDSYVDVAGDGILQKESSILWLARQQKKLTVLKKTLKNYYAGDLEWEDIKDVFCRSVIQELNNVYDGCNTLTFCVEMTVEELLSIMDEFKKDVPKGYIVINKDVNCGLYGPYRGGGSVLEIELERDVKLPIKNIGDIIVENCKYNSTYGYLVSDVYGMSLGFWRADSQNDALLKICLDE